MSYRPEDFVNQQAAKDFERWCVERANECKSIPFTIQGTRANVHYLAFRQVARWTMTWSYDIEGLCGYMHQQMQERLVQRAEDTRSYPEPTASYMGVWHDSYNGIIDYALQWLTREYWYLAIFSTLTESEQKEVIRGRIPHKRPRQVAAASGGK